MKVESNPIIGNIFLPSSSIIEQIWNASSLMSSMVGRWDVWHAVLFQYWQTSLQSYVGKKDTLGRKTGTNGNFSKLIWIPSTAKPTSSAELHANFECPSAAGSQLWKLCEWICTQIVWGGWRPFWNATIWAEQSAPNQTGKNHLLLART